MALIVAALGYVLLGGSASASCVGPPAGPQPVPVPTIEFVGVVESVSNNARTAVVHVEEVWHGQVPQQVTVHGSGAEGNNAATSVDRRYLTGTRYLFVPYATTGPATYADNQCSATAEYAPTAGAGRPTDAHPPEGAPTLTSGHADRDGPDLLAPAAAAGASVLLGAAVLVAVRRRRRP